MSDNDILVSVWMTTYNHERYIEEAIESIVRQRTTFRYELVIGEDLSEDRTREICMKYKNLYPDIIKLKLNLTNKGLIYNYYDTLQSCVGKYIAYCDGDDYWTSMNKLQEQVDFLEKESSYDMVFTDKYVQKYQNIYKNQIAVKLQDTSFESIILSNRISSPTVMIKAEVVKKYSIVVTENALSRKWLTFDYPLWLEVSRHHRIGYIDKITSVYRIVNDSGSHPDNLQKAYLWDKCILDIQLYYYNSYLKSSKKIKREFKYKFKEMVFHSRKSMILKYRLIAKNEFFELLKMNPLFYIYLILSKLGRLASRPLLSEMYTKIERFPQNS